MKTIKMIVLFMAGTFGLGSSGYLRAETPDESASYLGADLWVQRKSNVEHVVSANKKGLIAETGKGLKRVRYSSSCILKAHVYQSNNYVNIESVDFSYSHLGSGQGEHEAIREMNRTEMGADVMVSAISIGTVFGQELSSTEVAQINEIRDDQERLSDEVREAIAEGGDAGSGMSDFVTVKAVLNPKEDIASAYCVLVLFQERFARKGSSKKVQVPVLRAQWLGDLMGGIENEISFKLSLNEGRYLPEKYDLFLYSGSSDEIPTSVSKIWTPPSKP